MLCSDDYIHANYLVVIVTNIKFEASDDQNLK